MSLYGGIKFSIGDQQQNATAATKENAGPSENSSSQSNGKTDLLADRDVRAIDTGVGSVSASDKTGKVPIGAGAGSAGEWSAALKFAPRIPKPKAATTSRPSGAASSSNGGSASPVIIDGTASSSTGHATPTGSTYQPDIMRSAEPQLIGVGAGQRDETEVVMGPDGKPLARAPAMTLNGGAKGQGKGKGKWRDQGGNQAGDGKKRKKKKKKKNQQPLIPTFDPNEQYDPFKPNDLGEYQYYRKKVREERRAALIEEKRRRAAGESSGEGSSYYTDSSEEDAPRRDAPRMFAPPKQYSPPPSGRPPPPRSPPREPPPSLAPPPPPPPSGESGDDAYARRAAMAGRAAPSTGDDAYARRAAMSHAAAGSAPASTGDDAYARRVAMSQAATGDDAFARRAAMAGGRPQSLAPTTFAPPPAHLSTNAPPPPSTSAPIPPAPPPTSAANIPGVGSTGTGPMPPAGPQLNPVGSTSSTGAGPGGDFAAMLEERKRAAQAIAAKLQVLGAPPSTPTGPPLASAPVPPASVSAQPSMPAPADTDSSGTFAEKMFRKWGHVEGTGLGARGDGMVHALAAEHVEAPAKPQDPSQPLSKRQIAKQKAAAANAKNKNRKWVQHATSRGKIVNANEDVRSKEEKERFGEAGRIICLVGLVQSVDEVDEELSDEIGEECSKYGIVERVVLHMVEPPPEEPSECLRVFIVFSGMAGAWRAIKELDGRFFGGKKIRATYFDETKFDAGDRDGPIMP